MTPLTLARLAIALFAASLVFPIVGGFFVASPPPRWLGIADVVVAAAFFASIAFTVARAKSSVADSDRVAALRINQTIVGMIPVLLALYLLLGNRINWTVLIIGIAWRAWLLLHSMPYVVAALRPRESRSVVGRLTSA